MGRLPTSSTAGRQVSGMQLVVARLNSEVLKGTCSRRGFTAKKIKVAMMNALSSWAWKKSHFSL